MNIASHIQDADEDEEEEDDVDFCPSGPAAIAATNAFKQRLISTRLGLNQSQTKPAKVTFDDFIMKTGGIIKNPTHDKVNK